MDNHIKKEISDEGKELGAFLLCPGALPPGEVIVQPGLFYFKGL